MYGGGRISLSLAVRRFRTFPLRFSSILDWPGDVTTPGRCPTPCPSGRHPVSVRQRIILAHVPTHCTFPIQPTKDAKTSRVSRR